MDNAWLGTEEKMSDGREERNEQDERRKWAERERPDGRFDREDIMEREWPRDDDRERLDSLAAHMQERASDANQLSW
jgi:hypothetical protein